MTYLQLKYLIIGLLTGDNKIPQEEFVLQSLVGSALLTVANKADAVKLMTLDPDVPILRLGQGDYFVRKPIEPINDDDIVDIDDELIPAVARYVASMVSKEKGGIHVNAADRIVLDYNGKTWELIEQMVVENINTEMIESSDTCTSDIEGDTEFIACTNMVKES